MTRNEDNRDKKPIGDHLRHRGLPDVLAANRDLVQALLGTQPQLEPLRLIMAGLSRYPEAIGQVLAEPARRLSQTMRQWTEEVQRSAEALRRMTEEVAAQSEHFTQWWKEFEKQHGFGHKSVAPLLRRYKWLVTPSLPITLVFRVVKLGKRSGPRGRDINRLFVGYFAADNWRALRDMVDGWEDNPLFRKRLVVLRDCVRALQAAESVGFNAANVVLPTLMAQIDGLLTDYLWPKEGPRWTGYDKKKSEFQKRKGGLLQGWLEEAAQSMVLDSLLQSTRPGQAPQTPLGFSRHRVAHGEKIPYGRKDNVIRAFLVLDYLAHL
jgi:hypothetical protein